MALPAFSLPVLLEVSRAAAMRLFVERGDSRRVERERDREEEDEV